MTHKETLQSVLPNSHIAGTGGMHLRGNCPFCNKKDHFYINIAKAFTKVRGKYIGCWDCKKCKKKGNLPMLLKKVDKSYLIKDDAVELEYNKPLVSLTEENEIATKVADATKVAKMPTIIPPVGWRRIYEHPYLESRGWTNDDFAYYHVGINNILSRYSSRIILMVIEDSEYKAFVARSLKTKEWIKAYNRKATVEGKKKYLRYDNSENDFGKLLMGIDDIIPGQTHTVVVVEGPFDKQNVDSQLRLHDLAQIVCVASFGNTLSPTQADKIYDKGVRNIVILYDPDAVKQSKEVSYKLQQFDSVQVGYHSTKDPGELSQDELLDIMDNLQSRFDFYRNTVQRL